MLQIDYGGAPTHSRRGMMRWHIMYNLVVLRLISFGMDLHWARRAAASGKQPPLTPHQQPSADQPSMKVRQIEHHAEGFQAAASLHVCKTFDECDDGSDGVLYVAWWAGAGSRATAAQ